MLPVDTVTRDGQIADPTGLQHMLDAIRAVGVDGFMVDVWWGITEPNPRAYEFGAYRQLVDMAKERELQVQVVASFHQCGGNIDDTCDIPLPPFVRNTEGIWYQDVDQRENREYVSLFADDAAVGNRTTLELYSDWFAAFAGAFAPDLGGTVVQVMVGLGPAGELRYPSYPLSQWRYCGIGQFQASDPHALASLRASAEAAGREGWAQPPNASAAGTYNSKPQDTDFFSQGYESEQGRFFLEWYSSALKRHAAQVLSRAQAVFRGKVSLAGKVAGVHWWYRSRSHAAEATAGYYNTNHRNAYAEIADVFKSAGNATLDFTCLEMRDEEQPPECMSSPEQLVRQALSAAKEKGVRFSGENALRRQDEGSYHKILSYRDDLESLTYLRLGQDLLEPDRLKLFSSFVRGMHAGHSGVQGGRRLAVRGPAERVQAGSSELPGAARGAVLV